MLRAKMVHVGPFHVKQEKTIGLNARRPSSWR